MDVWKNVLLKLVKAGELDHSNTLSDLSEKTKIQIFEFLVAETLAQIYPEMDWRVSQVQGDQGVDLYGMGKCPLSPATSKAPTLLVLGQVKRRGKTYTFSDYRNGIQKMQEYYVSNALFENCSLLKLIFVVSTDNERVFENLEKDLWEGSKKNKYPLFYATIPSPIELINASEIIKYWKFNPDFIFNKLGKTIDLEQKKTLISFLNDIKGNFLHVSYTQNEQQSILNTFTKKISIMTQMSGIPLTLFIKWIPSEPYEGIQLLSPLPIMQDTGMKLVVRDHVNLNMTFRGLKKGEYSLGCIYIFSEKGKFERFFELGSANFEANFYYRYNYIPNNSVEIKCKQSLSEDIDQLKIISITGSGGIGKSSLIEQLKIYAENQRYLSISLAYPKDRINDRNFVAALLLKLIGDPSEVFPLGLPKAIRKYLHVYYRDDWTNDLENYFNGTAFLSDNYIAECIYMLLWYAALSKPVFIWFQDMHWINSETFRILSRLFEYMHIKKTYFLNRVRVFLEGRENEYIEIDENYVLPQNWDRLIHNAYITKYALIPWDTEATREYVYSLFNYPKSMQNKFEQSCENVIQSVRGYPLLILEHLTFLKDLGKIRADENNRFEILDYNWSGIFSDQVENIIRSRVLYYREKYPEIADCLVIWANICEISPESLWGYLLKQLGKKYVNVDKIINNSHFLYTRAEQTSFAHEYYKKIFQKTSLTDTCYVKLAVQWLVGMKEVGENEKYLLILLYKLDEDIAPNFLEQKIVDLLQETSNDFINYNLLKLLLQLPKGCASNKYPEYVIHYLLGESIIRSGDWQEGIEHFKKCLEYKNPDDENSYVYYMAACQELANLLCDLLRFHDAFLYCNKGTAMFESVKDHIFQPQIQVALEHENDKLRERMSVCFWFCGRFDKAKKYQIQAYKNSCRRNDIYMKLRCLYEIGTFHFHDRIDNGIFCVKAALGMADAIPTQYKQEKMLIEVQLLIGQLIKASVEEDSTAFCQILNKADQLCSLMEKEIFVYESILCHLVSGTCSGLLHDFEKALENFLESIELAEKSNSKNLLWKAHINAAQIYTLMGMENQSRFHAEKCIDIFENYWKEESIPLYTFEYMILEPVSIAERIMGISLEHSPLYTYPSVPTSKTDMLKVRTEECIFYLMN